MWRKVAPLLIILSVALNVGFLSVWAVHAIRGHWSGASGCAHDGADERVWCPLHRQLDVSDEQWRQLEPRMTEFRQRTQAVCEEVGRKRRELMELLASPQPDPDAIAAKQDEVLVGQRQVQQLVIDHLLAERQVLTPEQRDRLFGLLRQRSGCAGHGPLGGVTDAAYRADEACPALGPKNSRCR